jgi:lysozyme
MKIDQAGINFIKRWEGCKLKCYRDVVGLPTIGWGHLIVLPQESKYMTITLTQSEADDLLLFDITAKASTYVDKMKVDFTQNQYNIAISFCFNTGAGNFRKSTFYAECLKGNFEAAAKALRAYGGDKRPKGLANRRNAEADLFLS